MAVQIKQINPHACKSYLISNGTDKSVVLIDPVLEHTADYVQKIKEEGWELKYVIDTHTHADHISGCAALQDMTGCRYIMHRNAPARCPNLRINEDEEEYELLPGVIFKFFYTPGHTGDSLSVLVAHNLFTGDALFLDDGGAGRDDLPGGDPAQHWESIHKFLKLPDDFMVYPAHDYRGRQPSTIGQQKKTNPHLKHQSKEEFIQYINDLRLGPADWMKDVLKANYACAQDPKAAWIPVDTPACEIKGTIDPGINELVVNTITPAELKQKITKGDDMVMIDVREPLELIGNMAALKNSLNIPLLTLTKKLAELGKYKDKELIMICRSGHRANTAGQILKKAGFSRVKVLEGGMMSWVKTR